MILKNFLFIIILFIILFSIIFLLSCSTFSTSKLILEDVVTFNYPVPDEMITDKAEKEAMIQAKISQLEAINSIYWGDLLDEKEILIKEIQNIFVYINKTFPGFEGLDLNWSKFEKETIKKAKEIKNYGDFLSLLTRITFNLKEGHSFSATYKFALSFFSDDKNAKYNPTMLLSKELNRIGACVIISDKQEIVITKILDNDYNPYNFKSGDEIIGFNGISWKEWYHLLLEANIPISNLATASDGAIKYNLLKSAILNINLFEKINIKRNSGKLETLDVKYFKPLTLFQRQVCNEYISEVKGIPTPNTTAELHSKDWKVSDVIKSGIIENTNIGYIYIAEFPDGYEEFNDIKKWNPYETEFSKYFEKLILDLQNTNGLIFDLRYNIGGRPEIIYKGFSHLINREDNFKPFNRIKRDINNSNNFVIDELNHYLIESDNPNLFYYKPVVVMTGPDCVSACDVAIALFSKFTDFIIIGNHNNGSFCSIEKKFTLFLKKPMIIFLYLFPNIQ